MTTTTIVKEILVAVLPVLLAGFAGCLTGCGSKSLEDTEIKAQQARIWVDTFRDLGVDAKLAIQVGDGQFLGQSFNFSGTHVAIIGDVRPPQTPQP